LLKTDISVLLPTRGRTDILGRSLLSLADRAHDISRVEMLLAFDHDDTESIDYFNNNIAPNLTDRGARFTCLGFERLGYIRLNEYLNSLASYAQGHWLFFWGDDAVMESDDWDLRITEVDGFRVLRMPTHNCHPYAIFPIVPRKWYEMFGYLSPHQLTDSWISQVGYLIDRIHNIDVQVTHDRFDITGNNNDETFQNRPMLEGRPDHPKDFNYVTFRKQRFDDAGRIVDYLRTQGEDVSWFENVLASKQDPWAKMCSREYDPNRQIARQEPRWHQP